MKEVARLEKRRVPGKVMMKLLPYGSRDYRKQIAKFRAERKRDIESRVKRELEDMRKSGLPTFFKAKRDSYSKIRREEAKLDRRWGVEKPIDYPVMNKDKIRFK